MPLPQSHRPQDLGDAATSGRIFPSATVDVSRGGVLPDMVITLSNVKVKRFRLLGPAGDNLSVEEITLSCSNMAWSYPPLKPLPPTAGVNTYELIGTELLGTQAPGD